MFVDEVHFEQDGVCNKTKKNRAICGNSNKWININHKDSNCSKDHKSNLQMLCIDCHYSPVDDGKNLLWKHRDSKFIMAEKLMQFLDMSLNSNDLDRKMTCANRILELSWKKILLQVEYPSSSIVTLTNVLKIKWLLMHILMVGKHVQKHSH